MRKKINWLLILQGWAMLWVVIGHSPLGEVNNGPLWENVLFRFAYSFHMPLFMLVSGWLFYRTRLRGGQKWSYNNIVKDKVIRLLLPGLVFSVVAFTLKVVFPGEISRQTGLGLKEIAHAFMYPNDNPLRELWFIATLFWFFVLTPLWKQTLKDKKSMILSLIVLVVLHISHPNIEFLCLGRVCGYAIWFYCGLLISKMDIVENSFSRNFWLTILAGVLVYVIGTYVHPLVVTIGGILLSFGLALFLDRYIPQTFFSFRNYTYQIFLMGIFAQILIKILFKKFGLPYIPTYLLCIAAGLYVPVIISKIAESLGWKPLLLCIGLKKLKS